MFQEPYLSTAFQFVDQLRPIAVRYAKTVGQIAVSWVLRHPAITAAIVGARTAAQADENVGAAEVDLSADDLQLIENLLHQRFPDEKRI